MTNKFTPGPWFADKDGRIWRRDPKLLYENGGTVAGDKPIAFVNKGWYGNNENQYPVEENSILISAAPDMLEVLEDCERNMILSTLSDFTRLDRIRAAIAKAKGGAA